MEKNGSAKTTLLVAGAILVVLIIAFAIFAIYKNSSELPFVFSENNAQIYPEQAPIGTIFKLIFTANSETLEDISSVKTQIDGKNIFLFNDGKHGDKNASDGIFSSIFDSSSLKAGKYSAEFEISFVDGSKENIIIKKEFEIIENSCKNILNSGNPEDKVDVTFIGLDYSSLEDLEKDVKKYADIQQDEDGIFSYSPFKENENKFNIHMINELFTSSNLGCTLGCKGVPSVVCCTDKQVITKASQCPSDKIVVLINNENFCGSTGQYIKVCSKGIVNNPQVLVHEFGHLFGGLGDEYNYGIYPGMKKILDYNFPNCVNDCSKWPTNISTGCFKNCGYPDYYRSTESSCIMNGYVDHFCNVCLNQLNNLLSYYIINSSSEIESPAPSKEYVIEIKSSNGTLSQGETYVFEGVAPDNRIKTARGYEAKVISLDNQVMYSIGFDVSGLIFPFYQKGSESKPPLIEETEFSYFIRVPYFENGKEIQVYDSNNNQKVLSVDVAYLSSVKKPIFTLSSTEGIYKVGSIYSGSDLIERINLCSTERCYKTFSYEYIPQSSDLSANYTLYYYSYDDYAWKPAFAEA